MKCKYRLRTKKPLVVLVLCILAILAATSYGCHQSELKELLANNKNNNSNAAFDYKSTGELIRKQALESAFQQGFLLLVNKQHPVEDSYVPDDLTAIKYFVANRPAETRFMRSASAKAFEQLVDEAAEEGIQLRMTTAYRSYIYQNRIYNNYVSQSGEAATSRVSAKPGESEHQTGLAVDVSSISIGYQFLYSFADTDEGKWLAIHAHEFGFILRYPVGKEDITGYDEEPWHLRFVGLFAANEIYHKSITLEEYLLENNLGNGSK